MIVKDPEIQGGAERSRVRAFRAACRSVRVIRNVSLGVLGCRGNKSFNDNL